MVLKKKKVMDFVVGRDRKKWAVEELKSRHQF